MITQIWLHIYDYFHPIYVYTHMITHIWLFLSHIWLHTYDNTYMILLVYDFIYMIICLSYIWSPPSSATHLQALDLFSFDTHVLRSRYAYSSSAFRPGQCKICMCFCYYLCSVFFFFLCVSTVFTNYMHN